MKYNSGSAFRRALEDRLRAHSLQMGTPLVRLRKLVAFDRFLARLTQSQPEQWVLKGGFALQLRLGDRARTTKDIDILVLNQDEDIYLALRTAGTLNLKDWFYFEVEAPEREMDLGGQRYQLRALLDSRPFESFHVDVGSGDPMLEEPDLLSTPNLLSFAEIAPTLIPCYPLTQQIAEKLHAYTRSHHSGESSRVKDFVDMLLIANLWIIDATKLRQAIQATFDERGTHRLPIVLPNPPTDWEKQFAKMAVDVGLNYPSLLEATSALRNFINPILSNHPIEIWNPITWEWE